MSNPRRVVALAFVVLAAIVFAAGWQLAKHGPSAEIKSTTSSAESSTAGSQLEWDAIQSQLDFTVLAVELLETNAREDLEEF